MNKNYAGQRMPGSRLVAVGPTSERSRRAIVWIWQCDCGNLVKEIASNIKPTGRRSCGCALTEQNERLKLNPVHGKQYRRKKETTNVPSRTDKTDQN